jgi:hypothetical protein
VRAQARQALIEELATPKSREEVVPIAAAVADRFKDAGVKRIVVSEPDAEGGYDILVEASPLAPEVLMRLVRPGATVSAHATLVFNQPITLASPRGPNVPYTRAAPRAPLAPEPHPSGSGFVGTSGDFDLQGVQVVHPTGQPAQSPTVRPREQVTSDVIQVVSQNFRLEDNRREHNNHSHAEYKLVQQLVRDVPRADWPNLESVSLTITRMPCALCCVTLQEWFSLLGGKPVNVSYNQSHPTSLDARSNFPTSEQDLAPLRLMPGVSLPASPAALFATQNEASAASAKAVPVR